MVGLGRTKKYENRRTGKHKVLSSPVHIRYSVFILCRVADILSSFPQNWLNSILLG